MIGVLIVMNKATLIFFTFILFVIFNLLLVGMGAAGFTITNVNSSSKYNVIRSSKNELNCDVPNQLRGKTLGSCDAVLMSNNEIIPAYFCYPSFPLEKMTKDDLFPKRVVISTKGYNLGCGNYSLKFMDDEGFSIKCQLNLRMRYFGPWSY